MVVLSKRHSYSAFKPIKGYYLSGGIAIQLSSPSRALPLRGMTINLSSPSRGIAFQEAWLFSLQAFKGELSLKRHDYSAFKPIKGTAFKRHGYSSFKPIKGYCLSRGMDIQPASL